MPSFADLRLSTARLAFRPLVIADASALFEICADPEVMRYGLIPPWHDIAQAHASIERDLRDMAAGTFLRLGLFGREDNALLGECTLFSFEEGSRRAEVGYMLGRAAWGQGYAREAVAALLDWAFDALRLHRVEADVDPRNLRSIRLLEGLGFAREGLLRERWIVGEETSDALMFGLLASDRAGAGGA